MGRPTNTATRRLDIVQGLLRVIARRGYAGASIQEIAKEAKLNPGLIHYHFASKQEILLTLFSHLESLVEARMRAYLEAAGDEVSPEEQLDAMIDAFLVLDTRSNQRAVLCWTMLCAEAIHNRELAELFAWAIHKQQDHLERIFAAALGAARNRKAVREAAAAVLAAIHGSFLLGCATPGVMPEGTAAAGVKRMAQGLLGR
jgi:TetR/AcrR family transcriptional regulator, transcriptional repressor of bet genes